MQLVQSSFKNPMQPWPSLLNFGKRIHLTSKNLDLFYFEAGPENPQHMIMVHGLGDEADTWRHVFLPLAKQYHVFAVDLPGFGRSDKPICDYTPQFLMEVIYEFKKTLHIDNPILMGSSLGGILAHVLAMDHPECVNGLVLVGGGLPQSKSMDDWGLRLMQLPIIGEWLYTRLRKDPTAAFNSLRNVYHDLESLPESDRKFLYTRVNQRVWDDHQRRAYFSTLRNLTPWINRIQEKLPKQLKHLVVPTLVVRGEKDSLFSTDNANQVIEIQPTASKVIIDNTGHLPHQENPRAYLERVSNWLDKKPLTR